MDLHSRLALMSRWPFRLSVRRDQEKDDEVFSVEWKMDDLAMRTMDVKTCWFKTWSSAVRKLELFHSCSTRDTRRRMKVLKAPTLARRICGTYSKPMLARVSHRPRQKFLKAMPVFIAATSSISEPLPVSYKHRRCMSQFELETDLKRSFIQRLSLPKQGTNFQRACSIRRCDTSKD